MLDKLRISMLIEDESCSFKVQKVNIPSWELAEEEFGRFQRIHQRAVKAQAEADADESGD